MSYNINYLVLTCESCKAFFRRNALKPQRFMCPSNGKCNISVNTRQLCKKCRLEKCFANGMKKEFIGINDSNQTKNLIDLLMNLDESNIDATTRDQSTDSNQHHKHQELAIVPVFKEITDYNSLNALESSRVSELLEACNVFSNPLSKNYFRLRDREDIVKYTSARNESFITRIAQFSKCLNGFGNDQDNSAILDLDAFKLDKLHAIILFDPKRPNLIHKESVKLEQQLYIYLLQRHLLLKYPSESELKVQDLMLAMKDLNVLREIQYTYGIQEFMPYAHYFGPLMKETLDLK
ncbi:unnamed protein product [Medioppia subpectinata]|uniref:Nuclear receptor domain-containing protein n=1 Tax=Medioppia subpectinata TaxID=1979941 RepID=A0A7R9PT03_9ACAR|nr:unnamed protein product [Medioppia subpectinata]CAG2099970.1 unnamed protein product [Medioppia subpectinata]